jgi:hypothetical protein
VKRNGNYLNPVTAQRAMPPADPIPADEIPAFQAARDNAFERLDSDLPPGDTAMPAVSVN